MFGNHTPQETKEQAPRGFDLTGGTQWKFTFPNGFGASVIDDGYGGRHGLYELAVLDADGHLTYDTPVTDDVLGHLTALDVARTLDRVAALPAEVSA